jgi:hypothetical protein
LPNANLPALDNPEKVGLAEQGKRGGRRPPKFTFVDGRDHELTADELSERYTRVVGQDDVTSILRRNNLLVRFPLALLLAAGTFFASGEIIGHPSGCGSGTADALCKSAALTGIAALDLLGLWGLGFFSGSHASAFMDLDDADYLVGRYNTALEHPDSILASLEAFDSEMARVVRFRWGIGLTGGVWAVPGKVGGAGGASIQLGAQLNDWFGLYYAGMLGGAGAGSDVGAVLYTSLIGDLTLGVFQLGIGPSLDVFTSSAKTGADFAPAGAFFGAVGHAAIAMGSLRPGKKSHLMLGIDVHPTWVGTRVPTTCLLTLWAAVF